MLPRALLAVLVLLSAGTQVSAQETCELRVDPIEALGVAGSTPASLTVSGTAPDCARVDVRIACASQAISEEVFPEGSTAEWSVSLDTTELQAAGCTCNGRIAIQAACGKGPASGYCATVSSRQSISCADCPVIEDLSWTVESCQEASPGERVVEFEGSATGSGFSGFYRFSFGDGSAPVVQDLAGTPGQPDVVEHVYECPRSSPSYEVEILGVGCPTETYHEDSLSRQLAIPACPASCPGIDPIAASVSGCEVVLSTSVSRCEDSVVEYFWAFGDDNVDVTETPTTSHSYEENGMFGVSLALGGLGEGACTRATTVEIDQCGGGPPPGDGSDCGWRFWECFEWSWCWLFALITLLLVAGRLVLVAMYGTSLQITAAVSLPLDALLEALNAALVIILLALCPCEVTIGILLGAVAAIVIVLIALYYSAQSVPYWLWAIVIAVALIIAVVVYRGIQCS